MLHDPYTGPVMTRRSLMQGVAAAAVCAALPASRVLAAEPDDDPFVDNLIAQMTVEEKAGQLSLFDDKIRTGAAEVNPASVQMDKEQMLAQIRAGRVSGLLNGIGVRAGRELQRAAAEESRLKIPLIFAADIEHGLKVIFPIPVGEACSFDPDLCRRTARAAAIEGTARGNHWTFAPMVDVARDQRWGRVAEGAGEDPYLGSMIARARIEGFHGPDLARDDAMLACAKHFAGYGAVEGGMEYNTADIPETTLRAVHLPAFKSAADAGCLAFMSSFNDIAGVPSTANRHLLTDILRGEWGYRGLVVSDYMSDAGLVTHGYAEDDRDAARKAILAGCDMSMQSGLYNAHLPDLVASGDVPMAVLDEAVRRVLRVKKAIGLFSNPYRSLDEERERTQLGLPETYALAREAARRACVLLKNDGGVLPLKPSGQRIALAGPLAADRFNMNGAWVVFAPGGSAATVEAGFRARMADASLLSVTPGCSIEAEIAGGIDAAVAAAKAADVVVLCLGEAQGMSGEAQSRTQISIPAAQQRLAAALAATGKPVVVLLSHGRALALEGAVRDAPAIMATWFLGSGGGHAVAELLFGDYAPSGRLTVSFPQAPAQEPFYYNHRTTGRPQLDGADASFKARYRDAPFAPLYAFGHGLGYGDVVYGAVRAGDAVLAWDGQLEVSAEISNQGSVAAHEVVQLYVHVRAASLTQPVRALKGFQHVMLEPGATLEVRFAVTRADLAIVNAQLKTEAEPCSFDVWIAPSAVAGVPVRAKLLPPQQTAGLDLPRAGKTGPGKTGPGKTGPGKTGPGKTGL